MRTLLIIMTVVLTIAQAEERKRYVIPIQDCIGVYKNKTRLPNREVIYSVCSDDRLIVLADGGKYFKVKDVHGRTGWIEKRLVTSIARSSRMMFEDATIVGYLNNSSPIIILDSDGSGETAIRLERSFLDALRVNVNRETIERTTY